MSHLTLAEIETKIRNLYSENDVDPGDIITSLDNLLGEFVNERSTTWPSSSRKSDAEEDE